MMEQYWLVEYVPEISDVSNLIDENLRLDPEEPKYRNICFCNARGRENAKARATAFFPGNPDNYIVTPLTNPGEIVKLKICIDSGNPT
jgi:hypothetical protein